MGRFHTCGLFLATALVTSVIVISAEKNIICYYGTWATYRHGNGQFNVDNIDPYICTHLIYTFFGVDVEASDVKILDPYLDLEDNWGRGFIKKFVGLKKFNPQLKTLGAIGGWNEGSAGFSAIAADDIKRQAFADNVVKFCLKFGFDGIDIDWEYPAQRNGNPSIDKINFVLLLKELSIRLKEHDLLLTAAVAAAETSSSISYDIPNVSKYLDLIHLMTYDLHGPWENVIGINAPLFEGPSDSTKLQKELNVNASVIYWLTQGAPREKIILGLPLYGRTFTLRDSSQTSVGSLASGPGQGGPYTNEPGMIGYNEYCEKQQSNKWIVNWEPTQQVPYAYLGNQWVGYDDAESFRIKSEYILNMGLGGGMVWSVETDDFLGLCGHGKYPLLNVLKSTLNGNAPGTTTTITTSPSTTSSESTTTQSTITPSSSTSTSDLPSSSDSTPSITSTESTSTESTLTESTTTSSTTTPLSSTSTTATSSSTTESSTTSAPPSAFKCTADGWFRDPINCSIFYVCNNNIANKFNCPAGLLFDLEIKSCNWPAAVKC